MEWLNFLGPMIQGSQKTSENIGGSLFSIYQTNRQWNHDEDVYNRQRADALADWNMQNLYNSPTEQMARLKAAKLNPNLIYGNGSVVANSQAMPRSSNFQSSRAFDGPSPSGSISNFMNEAYQMDLMKAQIRSVDANTNKTNADTQLMAARLITEQMKQFKGETEAQFTQRKIDLLNAQFPDLIRQPGLENTKTEAVTNKTYADTNYTIDQNIRAWAKNNREEKLNNANIDRILSEISLNTIKYMNLNMDRSLVWQKIQALKEDVTMKHYLNSLNGLFISSTTATDLLKILIQKVLTGK
ncbi:MAG: DNA pilot protein [Microviridae sp.]|nr:MAG: DNA pilot protein [Microviridae sp.]